jgi:murein DD-endopeptidase
MSPALARALVMIAANGKTDASGHFEVALSQVGQLSLAVVGKTWKPTAPAKDREVLLLEGVALLSKRLGSDEAAVVALAVELAQVRYAQDRAIAAGTEHPDRFSGFGPYLPAKARQDVSPLINGTFALMTAYQLKWPVPIETRVSSPFGDRNHPVLGRQQMHKGVDLAVPSGTPIWAIAPGIVTIAGQDAINGRFVKLDHGHGLTSAYCHGSNLEVARGDQVKGGAVVISSGASGRVSGPHLHFQLELDGVPIDPQLFQPITP